MTTKKRSTKPKYKVSVKILGRTYTSSASDLRKALDALKIEGVAKGVSILEVTHGDAFKSVILPAPQTFRVFSGSGIVKEIAVKNLLLRFGGI